MRIWLSFRIYGEQLVSLNVMNNISKAIWNNKEIHVSLLYTKHLLTVHNNSDFFLKNDFFFLLKVSIVIPDFFQISLNYFQKNNNKKEIWNWNDSSDRQVLAYY